MTAKKSRFETQQVFLNLAWRALVRVEQKHTKSCWDLTFALLVLTVDPVV